MKIHFSLFILCFAFLLNILIIFPQVFKPRFTIASAVNNINNLVPQHATISYNGLIDIKRKDNKNPDYIFRVLWHKQDVINKYYKNDKYLDNQVSGYKLINDFYIYYPVIVHASLPENNFNYTKIQMFKKHN